MVVGFTGTYVIGVCHHYVVGSNLTKGEVYKITYKVCQWIAAGRWFSPGTPVSSNNKTDRNDIAEISLKVALNTINP